MQRVNFYQDRFRPQRSFLSLRTVVLSGLLLMFSLWAISLGLWGYLANKQRALGQTDGQGVVAAAAARIGVHPCRAAWDQLVATELSWDGQPVTPVLEQLAKVHPADVELTKIEISQGGAQLLIQGNILPAQSEQLPRYLQALARQSLLVVQDVRLEKKLPTVPSSVLEPPLLKFRVILGKEAASSGAAVPQSATP